MLNCSFETSLEYFLDNIFKQNSFLFHRSYFCPEKIYNYRYKFVLQELITDKILYHRSYLQVQFCIPKLIKGIIFTILIFVFVYLLFKFINVMLVFYILFCDRIAYLANKIKAIVIMYYIYIVAICFSKDFRKKTLREINSLHD